MPDITIVTPSYNQGIFLQRTIDSVKQNRPLDIEHIVIDGGSTDASLSIIRSYSDLIRYYSEKDNGQAHAINKAPRLAQSDIIGWLNSDDIYYPETLSRVLAFFDENPTINIVYGRANLIDENDSTIECYRTQKWDLNALKEICYICQPAVFFRRTILDKHGYLDESLHYCMDYEYWLRLALNGESFYYLNEYCLAGSRIHSAAKTSSQKKHAANEVVQMLQHKLQYVPGLYLINKRRYSEAPHAYIKILAKATHDSIRINGIFAGLKTIFLSKNLYRRAYQQINKEISILFNRLFGRE